jgi:AhpD family alkylhydroperoxidase
MYENLLGTRAGSDGLISIDRAVPSSGNANDERSSIRAPKFQICWFEFDHGAKLNLAETIMEMNYPQRHQELQAQFGKLGKALPGPISGFARLHRDAVAQGAIPGKMKELMALAIAIAIHCDDCIAYHVHDALRAGATRQEILEAIGVAIMMGGGPASMYGCRANEALEQFEALSKPD